MESKGIFEKSDDGDSPIYVGINYLRIVSSQIDYMRNASREAYRTKGSFLFLWLNELRTFYDLVESRIGLDKSIKEIDLFEYIVVDKKWERKNIKIKEKQKYEKWFKEIELMIERNWVINDTQVSNPFQQVKYKNEKEILMELSRCMRELMRDANIKHLIMPEGQKDFKEIAKSDWIDRGKIKDFSEEFIDG
jgi:hypothetical protein